MYLENSFSENLRSDLINTGVGMTTTEHCYTSLERYMISVGAEKLVAWFVLVICVSFPMLVINAYLNGYGNTSMYSIHLG